MIYRIDRFVLLVPVLLFTGGLLWLGPGATDDTYIHFQYARNLADAGEFSFNRGDPSYGATSPLWVLALALLKKLGLWRFDPLLWSRLLAWSAGVGSIVLLFRSGRREQGARSAWIAGCALAVDAWMIRWASVGMESTFVAFWVLLALLFSRRCFLDPRYAGLTGVAAGLAALSRPEAFLLVPCIVVAGHAFRKESGVYRNLGTFLLVFSVLVIPWALYIGSTTGSILPHTASAKSAGASLDPAAWVRGAIHIGQTLGSSQLLALLALVGATFSGHGRAFLLARERRAILLWLLGLPIAYVILDVQIISRYLLIVVPPLVYLGYGSCLAVLRERTRYPKLPPTMFPALALTQNVLLMILVIAGPTRTFSDGLDSSLGDMARWLRENTESSEVIAAPDIGLIGYVSERRILDLGGLIDPEVGEIRRRVDYESMLEQGLFFDLPGLPDPDFFLDRDLEALRFDGRVIRGRRLRAEISREIANLGIRQPGPFTYTLYRVTPVDSEDGRGASSPRP